MKRELVFIAAIIAAVAALSSCASWGVAGTVRHTIYIDIDNDIFYDEAAAETGYNRALGADTVEIYVNGDSTPAAILYAADEDVSFEAEYFTQTAVKFTGELSELKVIATGANIYNRNTDGYEPGTTEYSGIIKTLDTFSNLEGYSEFKDVEKFKVISAALEPGLIVYCAPDSMLSPTVSTSETFLFNERNLTDGQAEVLPCWAENPRGMSFDIYMFESNMYTKLSDIDDWDADWSYDEITSTGRSVNGTIYKMEKVNNKVLDAVHPAGGSYRSYLLTGLDSTGYYYIAVVTHFGNGTNFSSLEEIQIP